MDYRLRVEDAQGGASPRSPGEYQGFEVINHEQARHQHGLRGRRARQFAEVRGHRAERRVAEEAQRLAAHGVDHVGDGVTVGPVQLAALQVVKAHAVLHGDQVQHDLLGAEGRTEQRLVPCRPQQEAVQKGAAAHAGSRRHQHQAGLLHRRVDQSVRAGDRHALTAQRLQHPPGGCQELSVGRHGWVGHGRGHDSGRPDSGGTQLTSTSSILTVRFVPAPRGRCRCLDGTGAAMPDAKLKYCPKCGSSSGRPRGRRRQCWC
ncbi:hypothetical protein ACVWZX_005316 [Deinococcus sp. UYEF24]